ncbi:hypothetical protein, partial [Bradyrhizobium manausense]|uniref:hypothetical protein n=1 Tax=Bradyrhizobium manausense TaxID=989370 RepID=UPI001BA5734F
ADVQDRVESTPCASSNKFKPDSRGLVPGIHVLEIASVAWMAGTSPAMTLWKRFTRFHEADFA